LPLRSISTVTGRLVTPYWSPGIFRSFVTKRSYVEPQ
jgi:hypothetical protein